MTKFLTSIAVLLLGAGAPTAAVAQQEQTIKTAQEFLQKTSTPMQLKFQDSDEYPVHKINTRIEMIPDLDKCITKISGLYDYEFLNPIGEHWEHIQGSIKYAYIPWSSVTKIIATYDHVVVNWSSNKVYTIFYPSEDLAMRAAFAMEFLRVNCDPTADLAF